MTRDARDEFDAVDSGKNGAFDHRTPPEARLPATTTAMVPRTAVLNVGWPLPGVGHVLTLPPRDGSLHCTRASVTTGRYDSAA